MKRSNDRAPGELRPTRIEVGYTENPAGSVLITVGNTRVFCTATIEERVPHHCLQAEHGWVTAEYNMLPGSTHTRSRRERMRVGGRTYEIQRLIGRSLRAIINLKALGMRTIWIDCDVLQADGGTRCASITGAYVALEVAVDHLLDKKLIKNSPLSDSLAAVSCGLVDGAPLLDLEYREDVGASVDMNVVMTGSGQLVEVQATGEEATFTREELDVLLSMAADGIVELTEIQVAAKTAHGDGEI